VKEKRFHVGVLHYPGAQKAAVYGLMDLFESANRLAASKACTLAPYLLTGSAPPPRTLSALVLPPSLDDAEALAELRPLAGWLKARHREGTILCSVCAGGFLLGATGLLSGRPATTHWGLKARFVELFPDVLLDTDKLVVDDGDIVTAGGVMAWIDLGLLLIGRFLGRSTVLATSRQWLVDPGGREQRFYDSFAPVFTHGDDAVVRVQHLLHAKYGEKLTLATMVKRAHVSERTLLRRFQHATGHSPAEYLQRVRVERARELLENSTEGFDQIAWRLGYEDPGAFRRVFRRVMGISPGEYRRRFRVRPPRAVRGS
jgi:transcriptional regulator GlxA family with amidase domain